MSAYCQTVSVTATGSAYVMRGVTVSTTGTNTLNYGDILATGSTQTRSISNANGQKFLATGTPGYYVHINYTPTVTLSNALWVAQYGGTTGTITFSSNPAPQHTLGNSNYVNPVTITNGGSYLLTNSNGIGVIYIWVGGQISIIPNQPAGDYIGSFSITVSY